MAATGACLFSFVSSPALLRWSEAPVNQRLNSSSARTFSISKEQASSAVTATAFVFPLSRAISFVENGRSHERYRAKASDQSSSSQFMEDVELESGREGLIRFFDEVKDLTRTDGGPPRWFSPLECGSRLEKSPLLLYLPRG